MDGRSLDRERVLYYRELVARFGHHLALDWNIGEENVNTDAQRKAFAQWFADNDPYRHPVVLHTYPGKKNSAHTPLLGPGMVFRLRLRASGSHVRRLPIARFLLGRLPPFP